MSVLSRQYSRFAIAILLSVSLLMPLTATAQLGVLYDETFTGAELNAEVLAGNASYPAADVKIVVNVTQLQLSPASGFGSDPAVILFRMPILAAGTLSSFNQLKVTVVVDIVRPQDYMDTTDLDFGVAISDGSHGIGGMQGDWGTVISQGVNNWSLDAPDGGNQLTGEDFDPDAQLKPIPPLTYVIIANAGAAPTVEVTNSEPVWV